METTDSRPFEHRLSRRERQIMDILIELGEASAQEVLGRLPDPPSYSAVRALLSKLESKGQISHRKDGQHYLYRSATAPRKARDSAVDRLVQVFFKGSLSDAVTGLVDARSEDLSDEELDRIEETIRSARRERERSRS